MNNYVKRAVAHGSYVCAPSCASNFSAAGCRILEGGVAVGQGKSKNPFNNRSELMVRKRIVYCTHQGVLRILLRIFHTFLYLFTGAVHIQPDPTQPNPIRPDPTLTLTLTFTEEDS